MTAIPISGLKNTSAVAALCRESRELVLAAKNGYEEMVIVSSAAWREAASAMAQNQLYREIARGEAAMRAGEVVDYGEDTAQLGVAMVCRVLLTQPAAQDRRATVSCLADEAEKPATIVREFHQAQDYVRYL